jgi:hypothetical protein
LHAPAQAPRLQALFLLDHPDFSGLRCVRNTFGAGTWLIAKMIEVPEAVALYSKFFLDLSGNPDFSA